jgi:hypothetical protein
MTLTTAQLDRAIGVLLGTAAGDARHDEHGNNESSSTNHLRRQQVAYDVQNSFIGWAYLSLLVSGGSPRASSMVACRL